MILIQRIGSIHWHRNSGCEMLLPKESPLRLFFGIIIGIALTIGTVSLADALRPTGGTDEISARPMVNWDVVQHNLQNVSTKVQEGWTRLTGH
jgi:hypothetical protein